MCGLILWQQRSSAEQVCIALSVFNDDCHSLSLPLQCYKKLNIVFQTQREGGKLDRFRNPLL